MLYEVITLYQRALEGPLLPEGDVGGIREAPRPLCPPPGGRTLAEPREPRHHRLRELAGIRITSYNVCYTKLLRSSSLP